MTARQEAQANNELTYTGKPCKQGHTERYTANINCVECSKARSDKHRKDNPAYFKEAHKRHRAKKQEIKAIEKEIQSTELAIKRATDYMSNGTLSMQSFITALEERIRQYNDHIATLKGTNNG